MHAAIIVFISFQLQVVNSASRCWHRQRLLSSKHKAAVSCSVTVSFPDHQRYKGEHSGRKKSCSLAFILWLKYNSLQELYFHTKCKEIRHCTECFFSLLGQVSAEKLVSTWQLRKFALYEEKVQLTSYPQNHRINQKVQLDIIKFTINTGLCTTAYFNLDIINRSTGIK